MSELKVLKETFHLLKIKYEEKKKVQKYSKNKQIKEEVSYELIIKTDNFTDVVYFFDSKEKYVGLFGTT